MKYYRSDLAKFLAFIYIFFLSEPLVQQTTPQSLMEVNHCD